MTNEVAAEQAAHYAYCHSSVCPGCLPTDAELQEWDLLPLWSEMMARCIPQSPHTKTRDGALAAIRARDAEYRDLAASVRARPEWLSADGRPGRAIPNLVPSPSSEGSSDE
jgi:hypothetical protein